MLYHRGASPTKPCKHVPNLPHQILGQNPKFQIWFLGYAGHILHIIVRYAPVGFYASPQNNRVIGVCARFARAQIWFGHPRFGSMAGWHIYPYDRSISSVMMWERCMMLLHSKWMNIGSAIDVSLCLVCTLFDKSLVVWFAFGLHLNIHWDLAFICMWFGMAKPRRNQKHNWPNHMQTKIDFFSKMPSGAFRDRTRV